jgi:hypothetical protein
MTAAPAILPRDHVPTASRSTRAALALGRIEGRRLLRHPAYLAGVLLSAAFLFLVSETIGTTEGLPYTVWTSLGLYPVAAGTFLGTFTAMLRSRRHGTDELYDTAPQGASTRTGGHLVAVLWGAAGGMLLLAVAAVHHRLWDGVPVPFDTGVALARPSLLELAQGPAQVVLLGVLAVAVSRWVPSLLALPIAAVALLVQFVTGSWGVGGTARWFLPVVTHERAVGWVQVTPSSGYTIVEGFDVTSLQWHVAYLVGFALILGSAALLRTSRRRPALISVTAAGAILAALAGILQLP